MIKYVYDVAFGKDVSILFTKSFNKEIDVEFGVYKDMLSINLAPSSGKLDWKINFDFLQMKVRPFYAKDDSKVRLHRGYFKQWARWRDEFFNIIENCPIMMESLKNGFVVSGRSKGGGEAPIIALDIVQNFEVNREQTFIGMLEAPLVGNKHFVTSIEKRIPKENMYHVRYGADIVTMIPPTFKNPGLFMWFAKKWGVSFKDHATGCFDQDVMYKHIGVQV